MKNLKEKGMTFIIIPIGITIIGGLITGIATFYKTTNATDIRIGETNERVSVVETQTGSILKSIERIELSNAEIIKILMNK